MDAFTLAFSYGIKKLERKKIIITSITVGLFHFFMPLLGSFVGIPLFEYTIIKPRYILFLVFLFLSIDMFINYFNENKELRKLNLLGIIAFSFSVSFDSFSVGLGLNYLYNNIILSVGMFCIVSMIFTFLGFVLGKTLSEKTGRFAFILGCFVLFVYAFWVLTKA